MPTEAVWPAAPSRPHSAVCLQHSCFRAWHFACRMKMDVKNDNYNMFDLIAYRVKFAQHPRAGATWCTSLKLVSGFEVQKSCDILLLCSCMLQ